MDEGVEIGKDLIGIHQSIQKETSLRNLLGTTPSGLDRIFEGAIQKSARKIGKAEEFIKREDLMKLEGDVSKIRDWLWKHGELADWATETKKYIFRKGDFSAAADKEETTHITEVGNTGDDLSLTAKDERRGVEEIDFTLGFDRKYELTITFKGENTTSEDLEESLREAVRRLDQPHPEPNRYYSGELPIERMDAREYRILMFYLDQFIQANLSEE